MNKNIRLVECPRDAMQGWKAFIPTEKKVEYINALLKVGFHTIDFGSFVSPKAIPQMADTAEVLEALEINESSSKLLAIIANTRGAAEAIRYEQITYLGYPFSISPTFQLRNTNSTIEASLASVDEIQNLCIKSNKQLVVYLSMAFGNPYDDVYNEEILLGWAEQLVSRNISIISLADTVGLATPGQIQKACSELIPCYPAAEFGVHLHSTEEAWREKVDAAFSSGCRRFDGALKGIGGCPMANDSLVGNMNTEWLLDYLKDQDSGISIDGTFLQESLQLADQIFV
ncbi:MAG TPA: hydroxymethylglutaryl-CoA lyase [Flavisolibacter sp.]|jgi:hydroxymethylglutaryl-CoA lyase|nr:hydroxymethylglutaryl-CoA lyase [Flavisolibacter sp.]